MHLMMSLSILSVLRAHTCVCLITCTCVECVLLLMWSRSVTQSAGFAIRQHVKIWPHCLQPSFHIQEPQRSTSICESGSLLRLHAWSVKMESKWTDSKFRGGHRPYNLCRQGSRLLIAELATIGCSYMQNWVLESEQLNTVFAQGASSSCDSLTRTNQPDIGWKGAKLGTYLALIPVLVEETQRCSNGTRLHKSSVIYYLMGPFMAIKLTAKSS